MILIFGGTSDSVLICKKLFEMKKDFILSVTTDYGKKLAAKCADKIVVGKLTLDDMKKFILENEVSCIIDATHPYAVEVSKNAMRCSEELKIKYLRYERKSMLLKVDYDKHYVVENLEEACNLANAVGTTIFLGTGSKDLKTYVEMLPDKKLIARVLPSSKVIISCENLGLNSENIIAMKGPFEKLFNIETFKHYNIDLLITKESGVEGGFLEKIDACKELGIKVITIKRSVFNYPNLVHEVDDIKRYLED